MPRPGNPRSSERTMLHASVAPSGASGTAATHAAMDCTHPLSPHSAAETTRRSGWPMAMWAPTCERERKNLQKTIWTKPENLPTCHLKREKPLGAGPPGKYNMGDPLHPRRGQGVPPAPTCGGGVFLTRKAIAYAPRPASNEHIPLAIFNACQTGHWHRRMATSRTKD